jgi:hypothetical protein
MRPLGAFFQRATISRDLSDVFRGPLAVGQKWTRRVFEPSGRHHQGAGRIGIAALIELLHLAAVLRVFRKGCRDMHRCTNSRQREKPGGGFTMQPDAAVGVRIRMDKSFVESIGSLKLTPVSHRIARIGLADAAFGVNISLEIFLGSLLTVIIRLSGDSRYCRVSA